MLGEPSKYRAPSPSNTTFDWKTAYGCANHGPAQPGSPRPPSRLGRSSGKGEPGTGLLLIPLASLKPDEAISSLGGGAATPCRVSGRASMSLPASGSHSHLMASELTPPLPE